jgi:hypothetical protein
MNKFGLIAAALGGIATAGLAKFYVAARAYEMERAAGKFDDDIAEVDEKQAGKPAYEIVWIDADKADDREPLFGMNERVTIVNPYESAAWVDIETEVPMEYRITDMEFDMQDAVWRYKLEADGNEDDRWYSEEWLEAPLFTQMTKSQSEVGGMTDKVAGMTEEERREFWTDYNLAKLWEAMAAKDEKKAAECHAELKRLSSEKVGE